MQVVFASHVIHNELLCDIVLLTEKGSAFTDDLIDLDVS